MKFLGDLLMFTCATIVAIGIMYTFAMFGHEVIGLFLSLLFLGTYGEYWRQDNG